ncbi:MAG: DUF86 domain-containing protein [Desulfofustis sp. PB-SRB1]|jgi:uncharacterized protein with HEPN domain|nr:DUF86 domain-containing protein [Desulfofustis sp. PB-SRB1]HBH29991.1 DUF86 domain-containing protein [Desulfofustis sp.]
MVEAATLAISYLDHVDKSALLADVQLQDAVIRRLEIIGEAARRISEQTRTEYETIPWQEIIGMRNHIVHVYDGIDMEIVWHTVKNDLPALLQTLTR